MSGPFKVGDVVVCVDARRNPKLGPPNLERGRCYRVAGLAPSGFNSLVRRVTSGIFLVGVPCNVPCGFGDFRFRHLPKADEQFTAQMRALKPIKREQDA